MHQVVTAEDRMEGEMNRTLTGTLAICAMLIAGGSTSNLHAETSWQAIKPAVFQDRTIHPAADIVTLSAPYRTQDDRIIPVSVSAKAPAGRSIRSITLVADDNPMPVIAVLRLARGETSFDFGLNIRLDGTSPVRAIVETGNGQLYMDETLVKTSGQGACASPPVTDLDTVDETMGKMTFSDLPAEPSASGQTTITRRGKLTLTHPNLTGLQMNQLTLQHIPARYVDTMTVWTGDQQLFSLKTGITVSENPEIVFDYRLNGAFDITVVATDTDGTKFKSVLPLGPSS